MKIPKTSADINAKYGIDNIKTQISSAFSRNRNKLVDFFTRRGLDAEQITKLVRASLEIPFWLEQNINVRLKAETNIWKAKKTNRCSRPSPEGSAADLRRYVAVSEGLINENSYFSCRSS